MKNTSGKTVQARHIIDGTSVSSIAEMVKQRVEASPDDIGFSQYASRRGAWRHVNWTDVAVEIGRWQRAFSGAGLHKGDRVAVMLTNSLEWLGADVACSALGLVSVPLLMKDSPESAAYVVRTSGARLAILPHTSFYSRMLAADALEELETVIVNDGSDTEGVQSLGSWLPEPGLPFEPQADVGPDDLATIVFKAGTKGLPKGVMLSHGNLVWTATSTARAWRLMPNDVGVSYLPPAHILDRLTGVYAAIAAGAQTAFCRHPRYLMDCIQAIRPTYMLGVPRVYERCYTLIQKSVETSRLRAALLRFCIDVGWSRFEYQQGRRGWNVTHLIWPLLSSWSGRNAIHIFGGRMRFAFSSGAPLAPQISRALIGLGIPVLQGYGITEAGLVGTNRLHDNEPRSAGTLLRDVEYKVGPDNEFVIRSPGVMIGYWGDDEATSVTLDMGGWLHTGDKVSRLNQDHLYLTGRIKQIICMANGQKASPTDLEEALSAHAGVKQAIVVGEALPYLAALVVPTPEALTTSMEALGLSADCEDDWRSSELEKWWLNSLSGQTDKFPIYSQIKRIALVADPWQREDSMLDQNGAYIRRSILRRHNLDVERLYKGHFRAEKTDSSHNVGFG